MAYRILLKASAAKELEKLETSTRERMNGELRLLAEVPRPPGCKKLVDQPGVWRTRVGSMRVLYTIDDAEQTVTVLAFARRDKAY